MPVACPVIIKLAFAPEDCTPGPPVLHHGQRAMHPARAAVQRDVPEDGKQGRECGGGGHKGTGQQQAPYSECRGVPPCCNSPGHVSTAQGHAPRPRPERLQPLMLGNQRPGHAIRLWRRRLGALGECQGGITWRELAGDLQARTRIFQVQFPSSDQCGRTLRESLPLRTQPREAQPPLALFPHQCAYWFQFDVQ